MYYENAIVSITYDGHVIGEKMAFDWIDYLYRFTSVGNWNLLNRRTCDFILGCNPLL